jgi:hypothetical protein
MLESVYGILVREDVLGERSSCIAWVEPGYGQTLDLSRAHSGGQVTSVGPS